MNRFSTIAAKVAKDVISHGGTGLGLDGLSNEKAKRLVNHILGLHTKGSFTDESWAPVYAIFKALDAENINWTVSRTDYTRDSEGKSSGKEWKFDIQFTNNRDRHTTLYGMIRAAWMGTVQDPSAKYDLVGYVS